MIKEITTGHTAPKRGFDQYFGGGILYRAEVFDHFDCIYHEVDKLTFRPLMLKPGSRTESRANYIR
jgi:hypothetical protein